MHLHSKAEDASCPINSRGMVGSQGNLSVLDLNKGLETASLITASQLAMKQHSRMTFWSVPAERWQRMRAAL